MWVGLGCGNYLPRLGVSPETMRYLFTAHVVTIYRTSALDQGFCRRTLDSLFRGSGGLCKLSRLHPFGGCSRGMAWITFFEAGGRRSHKVFHETTCKPE